MWKEKIGKKNKISFKFISMIGRVLDKYVFYYTNYCV